MSQTLLTIRQNDRQNRRSRTAYFYPADKQKQVTQALSVAHVCKDLRHVTSRKCCRGNS